MIWKISATRRPARGLHLYTVITYPMKISLRLPFALLTVCAALPASGLWAQAPAAAPATTATPSVSAPAKVAGSEDAGDNEGRMRARAMTDLTPEEQGKLRAARKAAMQDPAVKAAEATRATDKKGYRQAVKAAMLKADPSVGPILEKLREGGKVRKKDLAN